MPKYTIIKKDNGLMDLVDNGSVILEDIVSFYTSRNGISIFKRKNSMQGWIKDDGIILADNLLTVYNFSDGVGRFQRTDGTEGRMKTDGSIVIDGITIINGFDPKDNIAVFKRQNGNYGLIRIETQQTGGGQKSKVTVIEKVLIDGAKMIEKDKIKPFHYIIDNVLQDVSSFI